MKSDFYHEFARAYFGGISPELYALANIATNGAAPEDHACSATDKYAGADDESEIGRRQWAEFEKSQGMPTVADPTRARGPASDIPMQGIYDFASRVAHAATSAAVGKTDSMLHHHAATLHDIAQQLAAASGNTVLADKHARRMKMHQKQAGTSGNDPNLSMRVAAEGGRYIKPELSKIKQPESLPGQKLLFACDQSYALDAEQPPLNLLTKGGGLLREDDLSKPQRAEIRQRLQDRGRTSRAAQSVNARLRAADTMEEPKTDYAMTGTGTRVECAKNSLPSDDISAPKAKEMLANPPHGKKLTGNQERMLQAAAHK